MQDDWQTNLPDKPPPTPPPLDRLPEYDWHPWGNFFSFNTMLTPILVRILFVIGLPVIAFGSICYIISIAREAFMGFIVGVLLAAVLLIAWRVVCETAIVLFSIYEELRK